MQYQESNNNQILLVLCKATEWEKGVLDCPPFSFYLYSCIWSKICTSWICHLQNRDNFCVHQQKFKNVLITQPLLLREYFCQSSTFVMILIMVYHGLCFFFQFWSFHHEMLTIWYHAMTSEVIWWLTYDNKNFRTKLGPSSIKICWVVYMDL